MQNPFVLNLYREVEGLLAQIESSARHGGSKEKRLDNVIECLGKLRRLANEYPQEIAIEWLAEKGIHLTFMVGLPSGLQNEIRTQIFDWLHKRGAGYFGNVREEAMIYFWCKRAGLGVRIPLRNFTVGNDSGSEPIFSDDELDKFYADDPSRIWKTLANKVCPRYDLYLRNPFADASVLYYYQTYRKALEIPVDEITIPNDGAALT